MSKYVSEFDQWLRRYKQENPDTESLQRAGRARLWDKRPEDIERPGSAITNKQTGYVYYPTKESK